MQERQKRLLGELISHSPGYSFRELANICGSSEKTIRSDITTLNTYLQPYHVYIQQHKTNLSIALHHKSKAIEAYTTLTKEDYKHNLLTTAEDRKIRILFRLLDQEGFHSMESLAEEAYVSKATIFANVHELEDMMETFKHAKLEILAHKGIRIVANEMTKRDILVYIFHLRISRSILNKYINAYLSEELIALVPDISRIITHVVEKEIYTYPFDEVYQLICGLLISIKRYRLGLCMPKQNSVLSPLLRGIHKAVTTELHIPLPETEIAYLQNYERNSVVSVKKDEREGYLRDCQEFYTNVVEAYPLEHNFFHSENSFEQFFIENLCQQNNYTVNKETPSLLFHNCLCAYDMCKFMIPIFKKNHNENLLDATRYHMAIAMDTMIKNANVIGSNILIYESNSIIANHVAAELQALYGNRVQVFICTTSLFDAKEQVLKYQIDLLLMTKSIVSDFLNIPVIKVNKMLNDTDKMNIHTYILQMKCRDFSYRENILDSIDYQNDSFRFTYKEKRISCSSYEVLAYKNIAFISHVYDGDVPFYTSQVDVIPEKTLYIFLYPRSILFQQLFRCYRMLEDQVFIS